MFGGGSPVFAQMPSYTPVTRGSDLRQQIPEPPAYAPYPAAQQRPAQPLPPQSGQQPASGLSYPGPHAPSPLNYASSFAEPAASYESPQPGAAPSYQNSQYATPSYHAAPSYQPAEFGGQAYQQPHPSGFSGAEHSGSQAYPASSYDGAQGLHGQSYRDQGFADASFPESGAGDASFPETSFDQSFADANFANQSFAEAGYPQHQGFDASFPEQVFPSAHPHDHQEQLAPDGYGHPAGDSDHGFESFADDTLPDYAEQLPKIDPRRQLQAFDAIYDQPPQIALGSTEPARRQPQEFYEGERLDADFLDEGQILPPPGAPAKTGLTLKSRSAFMVGSALLGAIALGGALAFAYKQSGGGLGSEPPPLVQADSSPVKEVPDQPGGKEFPHKNKLIYDRLQNADEPEAERLVSRQEDVAVPALPGPDMAAMPAPVATTDAAPPTTQALPGAASIPVAAVDDPAMPDGGPRKVKTMVVRPDGSVETPPVPAAAAEAAPAGCSGPGCSGRGCGPCRARCANAGRRRSAARGPGCAARGRRPGAGSQAQACRKAAADRRRDAGRRRSEQICRASRLEEESDRGIGKLRRYAAEISDAPRQLPAHRAEGRSWHQRGLVPAAHRSDHRQDGRQQALQPAQVARPA